MCVHSLPQSITHLPALGGTFALKTDVVLDGERQRRWQRESSNTQNTLSNPEKESGAKTIIIRD